MILQLDPPIPMSCPKGEGLAIFLTDYGCEYNLIWTIAIDATGEIWSYQNPKVRMLKNITMERIYEKEQGSHISGYSVSNQARAETNL